MRFVFWQNCLSPHQLPYIVKLKGDSRVDEVLYVAPVDVLRSRKDMGWASVRKDIESQEQMRIVLNPTDDEISKILEERPADSYHIFGGISGDKFVFHALQLSMSYDLHRVLIAERPDSYYFKRKIRIPKPTWLHRIRFRVRDRKYAKKIEYVFAMGRLAVKYYNSLGMSWKVFPFSYCTNVELNTHAFPNDDLTHFIFCGSLVPTKNPKIIIKAMLGNTAKEQCDLKYVGDGFLRTDIELLIKDAHLENRVHLLGKRMQTEVPRYMQNSDVLILPSIYDGWGAVVNEALQAGCYIICSDACGSCDLMYSDQLLGRVFHRGDVKQLSQCISWCCEHLNEIRANRQYRQQWANDHISGTVLAKYMIDCLTGR